MANFENERDAAVPIGFRNPLQLPRNVPPGKSKWVDTSLSKGMITVVDPADIPIEAVQLARNYRFRFDYAEPRASTILFTPAAPGAFGSVYSTYNFKKNDGSQYFFEFFSTSVYLRGVSSWTPYTYHPGPDLPTYVGTGDGLMVSVLGTVSTVAETWIILFSDATNFSVTGSVSGAQAAGVVDTPYTNTYLSFTINSGDVPFIVGDEFTIVMAVPNFDGTKYEHVTAFDRMFSTDGVNPIVEVDTTHAYIKSLGNAPGYKYLTAFDERIVGANLTVPFGGGNPNPTQLGWSAQAGITGDGLQEWDAAVDETAGATPLVDSPLDLADYITGLFGFTNVLIVLRERSIWLGTRQPVASNPFYFYAAIPSIGCDCPGSAAAINDPDNGAGIAWVDTRTGTMWAWFPEAMYGKNHPTPIGRPIEKDLLAGITDPTAVFASFNERQSEYTVCIPRVGSNTVTAWTYNFRTQCHSFAEYDGITHLNDIDLSAPKTAIKDLIGPIGSLVGPISGLSPNSFAQPVRIFGRSDSSIIQETESAISYVVSGQTVSGAGSDPILGTGLVPFNLFPAEIIAKSFTLPTDDIYVAELRLEYIPTNAGTLTLYYSRDGGVTWSADNKIYTIIAQQVGIPQILKWMKLVRSRRYSWRLVSFGAQFRILGYEVHIYEGGESSS